MRPGWTTFFAVLIHVNKLSLWISALSLDETTSPGNTWKQLPQAILLQIWHMTVVFHRCSLIRAGYFCTRSFTVLISFPRQRKQVCCRWEKSSLWWWAPSRWSVTWHGKEKYSVCWPNTHLQRLSRTRTRNYNTALSSETPVSYGPAHRPMWSRRPHVAFTV